MTCMFVFAVQTVHQGNGHITVHQGRALLVSKSAVLLTSSKQPAGALDTLMEAALSGFVQRGKACETDTTVSLQGRVPA